MRLRKLVQRLLVNKTLAGARVYDSLPYAVDHDDCPCLLIYTSREQASAPGRHTVTLSTTLSIDIEIRVSGNYHELQDQIDSIEETALDLILGSEEFQNEIESVSGITTNMSVEDGSKFAFALAILSIQVEYKKDILPRPDGQFLSARINVDAINPHDPNLAATGPDGRIEATVDLLIDQTN
jgi:hypothetical protein